MKPLTPEQRVRKELIDRLEEYKAGRTVMFRAIPEQEIGGLVIDILETLNAHTEERVAHSKSEYRRLKAQGVDVQPPDTPCPECGNNMRYLRGVTNKMKPRKRWICLSCGYERPTCGGEE